jgi:histidinol phosphatase-like enzyme
MCKCRKPKTGMIKEAIKKYKINPKKSFLIGDRLIDIQAGRKMNCMNIFIDRNYDEKKPEKVVPFVKSFRQAAKYILKNI